MLQAAPALAQRHGQAIAVAGFAFGLHLGKGIGLWPQMDLPLCLRKRFPKLRAANFVNAATAEVIGGVSPMRSVAMEQNARSPGVAPMRSIFSVQRDARGWKLFAKFGHGPHTHRQVSHAPSFTMTRAP